MDEEIIPYNPWYDDALVEQFKEEVVSGVVKVLGSVFAPRQIEEAVFELYEAWASKQNHYKLFD